MTVFLILLLPLLVLGVAVLIVRNVVRYRSDVRSHWYSIGYRDAEMGTMWYNIQNQANPVIINAYMAGYTEYKESH